MADELNTSGRATFPYDRSLGLYACISRNCDLAPDRDALLCGDESISYRGLLDLADKVAARLISTGVQPGDRVAIVCGRSIPAAAAMLGVLRLGAAYVPLDPAYDKERLGYIIGDVAPTAVLWVAPYHDLARDLADEVRHLAPAFLAVSDCLAEPAAPDTLWPAVNGGDPACILYTSGSTGRPKGVIIPHRAISRLAFDQPVSQIFPGDRVMHASTVAADCALYECWSTLCAGGTVAVLDQPKPSVEGIAALFRRHQVTLALFYAGLFHVVAESALDALASLRVIGAGGDVMSPVMVARVKKAYPALRVMNVYGPTEGCVFSSIHEVVEADLAGGPLPIGRAEPHGDCLVVDDDLRPVPEGEPGQMVLTGDGVADGYLNLPDQTREKFVPDPRPGVVDRAYLTGDLVRKRADGVLEFLGRADRQVKVGGRRIELDEIEHVLRGLPMLADAAVAMVSAGPAGKRIGAFVKPEGAMPTDEKVFLRQLREALAAHLPVAMHPGHFLVLPDLPLTENGKVDRRALASLADDPEALARQRDARPGGSDTGAAVARRDQRQIADLVAQLWQEMLHCDLPDAETTFFEAGGTSLQLIDAHARLERLLGFHFDLTLLFETPRLGDLAKALAAHGASATARPWRADAPKASVPACAAATRPVVPDAPLADGAIAIVGMAARLPGVSSLTEFWQLIRDGRHVFRRFEPAELEDSFTDAERQGGSYVPVRPMLADVDLFDAKYFKLYPREAAVLDPQARVFLETCVEALEDAGHDPRRFGGAIGVFAGASMPTYLMNNVLGDRARVEDFTSNYQVGNYAELTGSVNDSLATRVAYKLDLHGPALTVQTACSTSLVAVAQAVVNLRTRQCDMALAGGVSITFPQKRGYFSLEGGMVSSDGVCRPFDAGANGTIFGHGAGCVALRRLEDALADGDQIHAVIRGIGLNNDGAGKISYTAPSVTGQADAIRAAHRDAGVDPATISFVECHGTATPLGDPIEVRGLAQAFAGAGRDAACALGSVKGNVGHLDAAAGVTSLIKTALMLKRREIPVVANFTTLNPKIDLAGTPFRVPAATAPWPSQGPRRAGISSFGVGGTNAHLVLEEAPDVAPLPASDAVQILPLSAKSPEALQQAATRLAAALRQPDAPPLSDVAFTLQDGRIEHEFRAAIAAHGPADAAEALDRLAPPRKPAPEDPPAVAFMFPGQGSQYPGMGSGLYQTAPDFAHWVDLGSRIAAPLLGLNLNDLLCFGQVSDEAAARALRDTRLTQPALYIIQFACAKLWMARGVSPAAMIGHSVGEFAAAALAGVFDFETGLKLIAARGRLMQDQPPGQMLSVRADLDRLTPFLDGSVDLAAMNAPQLQVLAGPAEAIAAMAARLDAAGIATSVLHTSHAFHSRMMDPVSDALAEEIAGLRLDVPQIPWVSCVTGDWITTAEATDPAYWARQARQPVNFAAAVTRLAAARPTVLLETGAGGVLSAFAAQTLPRDGHAGILSSLPDHRRDQPDDIAMAQAFGRLWSLGVPVDWSAFGPRGSRRVSLPTYPFERKRFWVDAPSPGRAAASLPIAPEAPIPAPVPLPASPVPEGLPIMTLPAAAPSANRKDRLTAEILALLSDLSGETLTEAEASASFLELGFDSLFLGQVAQRLGSDYGANLTFRQLLSDYPSPVALVAHLDATLPPDPVAAPAAAPVAPLAAPAAAAQPALALPQPGPAMPAAAGGLAAVMQAQIQAMQGLFAQQIAALSGAPSAPVMLAAPAAPTAAIAAAPAPAATAPQPARAPEASETEATPPARPVFTIGRASVAIADLSAEQKTFVDDLCRRYSARSPKSKAWCDRYRPVLADPRTAAGFRAEWKELVYPVVADRSKGARIWDIDGNEYIDLVNGFGQTAFGHSPDFVVNAVNRQMERGFAIGPQSDLAGPVAERFARMVGHERVTFCNTGSEAVMAAMRLARAVTGRELIVVFGNDYHGQFDEVLVKGKANAGADPAALPIAPGIPRSGLGNMRVLPYAAPQSLDWLRENASRIAAVLVEPVQSRHPELRPVEFVREVRRITRDAGAALVMDEVVTGFRVGPRGMQGEWDIDADMATYGKVVGGGMPIGVLAGKRRFMDALDGGAWTFGDESMPQTAPTFFAGTFVRHPLVLAAVDATLDHIERNGPDLWQRVAQRTQALVEELNAILAQRGLPRLVEGYSSWIALNLANHDPNAALIFPLMRMRGVHVQIGYMAMFTTAHSEDDYRTIARGFTEAIDELQAVGILRGTGDAAGAQPAAVPAPSPRTPTRNIPLTEEQREIWMTSQLGDQASCAFNESTSLDLTGPLDIGALARALARVIERHDGLRQVFARTGDTFDVIAPFAPDLSVIDLSAEPDPQAALTARRAEDSAQPIDLVEGPPLRVFLARLAPGHHVLVVNAHHIVCDGWSFNVFYSELSVLYAEETGQAKAALAPAPSFAALAQSRAESLPRPEVTAYWRGVFAEVPDLPDLPTDRPRAAVRSFAGATVSAEIDAEVMRGARKAGAACGCTLFATLFAAVQIVVSRLSGSGDVILGVPTAGQALLPDSALIGHCVNFLPIRAPIEAGQPMAAHLGRVGKAVIAAFDHQDYTYGTLVRELKIDHSLNRLPLTEVQFNLEKMADVQRMGDLTARIASNPKAAVNFDLFFNVVERKDRLRVDVDYNRDLYDADTIRRWIGYLETTLREFAKGLDRPAGTFPILTAEQTASLIRGLQPTAAGPLPSEPVLAQIEAQARLAPAKTAIEDSAGAWTYERLIGRVDAIAAELRQVLPRPGGRVALAVDRTADSVAAMLGVMKAGHAFVPLDITQPSGRLGAVLDKAHADAILHDGPDRPEWSDSSPAVAVSLARIPQAGAPMAAVAASDDPTAYILFTSGSTGEPKGVEVGQRALANLLASMAREPGFTAADTMLAVTTISFDISLLELLLPLVRGGKVVIATKADVVGGFPLIDRLKRGDITHMQATPTLWAMLLEAGLAPSRGLTLLCGGEPLPADLAQRLLAGGATLWNLYGPTETTIWSAVEQVRGGDRVTIGHPVAGTQLLVLGPDQGILPAEAIGELWIGGTGLAKGYFNRPDLTAAAFQEIVLDGQLRRLYRTGDLARRLPDGRIVVLGRKDDQIKLRGFRIELGEIEAAIRAVPGVEAAAVALRPSPRGGSQLVGYIVPDRAKPAATEHVASALASALPDYMVPTGWMVLDELPKTANGKLDRKALPSVDLVAAVLPLHTAATTDTERKLAEIWEKVLGISNISTTSTLYALGADSLTVFRIAARMMDAGLNLEAKDLLQHPSIASLAAFAEQRDASGGAMKPTLRAYRGGAKRGL